MTRPFDLVKKLLTVWGSYCLDRVNLVYCAVEQLVARWAHNPKVAGSSPARANLLVGDVAQLVRATES